MDKFPIIINADTMQVLQAGREVVLEPLEWQLLFQLVSRDGMMFEYDEALWTLWPDEQNLGSDVLRKRLRVCLTGLRRKLNDNNGDIILTVNKVGMKFVGDGWIERSDTGPKVPLKFALIRTSTQCAWREHPRLERYKSELGLGADLGFHQAKLDDYPPDERPHDRTLDPVFDISLLNEGDETLVFDTLGVEPLLMWTELKGLPPSGFIETQATFNLALRPMVLGETQLIRLVDPVYMQAGALFRFDFQLSDYNANVRDNELLMRLVVGGSDALYGSPTICLGRY